MNRIAILFTIAICFAACSSPSSEVKKTELGTAGPNTNSVANLNSNAKMVPREGVDPTGFDSNSSDTPVTNQPRSNQSSPVGPRSAPDNSELNTTMRPDGTFAETRTFKDHPQLIKIERVTSGQKVSLKIYLKNGKVVEVPKEKLPEFQVIAPGTILLAAGVKPAAPAVNQSTDKTAPTNESVIKQK